MRSLSTAITTNEGGIEPDPQSTGNQGLEIQGPTLPIHRPDHKLPPWLVEYFEWHRQERAELNAQNWNTGRFKYLISRCLKEDLVCGGTSDRLQSLPYQLLLAHLSKRILLIMWQRPFPLEEFLLPPRGGLEWRVPKFMTDGVVKLYNDIPVTYAPNAKRRIQAGDKNIVIWTRDQTHNHGSSVYDQHHEQLRHASRFNTVFHDAWRMVLTPSPPVALKIEHWMNQLGLVPGEYAATHVRALYGVHNRSLEQIKEWTHNAIHCTTQLRPEGPFFFASDSSDAQREALHYGRMVGLNVVSRFHETEPLHMDGNATGRAPQDYYDAFVDLYLLGNTRALAYNVGGYGKMGLIMGFDSTAGIQHQMGGVPWTGGVTSVRLHHCALKRPTGSPRNVRRTPSPESNTLSFFVPPMEFST